MSTLTVEQVVARARAVADALGAAGLGPGDRAMLMYPPGLGLPPALLGCLLAGVIAVPAPAPSTGQGERLMRRLLAMAASASAKAVLVPNALLGLQDSMPPALADARWIGTDELHPARPGDPSAITTSGLAYLQYTSGSTSDPRGVRITHANLMANCRDVDEAYAFDASSVLVSWVPLYHDLGLVYGVLMPIYAGCCSIFMDPAAFVQRPIRWMAAMSKWEGTHSVSPNFGFDLAVLKTRPEQRSSLDLSSWRVALNGAEPIRRPSEDRFVDTFAPHGLSADVISHSYGLSEATAKVTAEHPGRRRCFLSLDARALEGHRVEAAKPGVSSRTVASCGQVAGDMRVAIVTDGVSVAPDQVGEVWLQGSSVADGYDGDAEATAATFGGLLQGEAGRWLRTGDLGFLADGQLYVTGRSKDLIILRGENHYPQDLEWATVESHASIRPGGVVAFSVDCDAGEGAVVLAELRSGPVTDPQPVLRAIHGALSDLGIEASVALLAAGSVPRTSSGKVQRALARRRWIDGDFAVLHRSQPGIGGSSPPVEERQIREVLADRSADRHSDLVRHLREMFAAELGIDIAEVEPDQSVRELGLDSIRTVDLGQKVADSLGISLYPGVVQDHPSASALATFVLGRPEVS